MQELKRNKLRTDYGNKTGDKIRTEHFITYNHDYVHWLEDELLKLFAIPVVMKSVCDDCTAYPFDERGKTPLCSTCKDNPKQTVL